MNYILEDLMSIRKHREKLALYRKLQAKEKLAEANSAFELRNNELLNFLQWRKNEEERLFEEIKNKYQELYQIDIYNQHIVALKNEQERLEKEFYRAGQNVRKSEEELEKENATFKLQHRQKKKLEEHKRNWLLEMSAIEQRKDENEMDESGTMRFNTTCS